MAAPRVVQCDFWFFLIFLSVTSILGVQVDLGGNWIVEDEGQQISTVATVPGGIFTDLMRGGFLDDPYYRSNNIKYRWVSYRNWTYSRSFTVSEDVLNHKYLDLVCEGLDTVAAVYVNNKPVAKTKNMFISYRFDVKSLLLPDDNTVKVEFTSPVLYAAKQAKAHAYDVPPDSRPAHEHGEKFRQYVRTRQSSFSWDWGPAFPTVGIWKPIFIDGYTSPAKIKQVTVSTMKTTNSSWAIMGKVFFHVKANITAKLVMNITELNVSGKVEVKLSPGIHGQQVASYRLSVLKPVELWWPNGHGKQKLYQLDAEFIAGSAQNSLPVESKKSVKFGFRTVRVIEKDIQGGKASTFYFEINDKPIFMKGSNWIPGDAFQERMTAERTRNLLQSAADVGMTMMRVWGGGIYETDVFYDTMDELGIMIWQDFMYGSSMYPADPAFLETVRGEITYQVQRLQHHASIVIWSGNNECGICLSSNTFGTASHYQRYYNDYIALYINTVLNATAQEDQSRPIVSTSPSNGRITPTTGWIDKNANDNHHGDVHFYTYSGNLWDWRRFPKPKFCSEYGFESYPSFETLRSVSVVEDWYINSTFCSERQHHGNGNQQLLKTASAVMRLPNSTNHVKQFKDLLYVFQINQAMVIKTESELYRRLQGVMDGLDGFTMGALIWQLNDNWQGPSWATLEYTGKWKMLHYYTMSFFKKTVVVPWEDGNMFKISFVQEEVPLPEPGATDLIFREEKENPAESAFRSLGREEEIRRGEGSMMEDTRLKWMKKVAPSFDTESWSPGVRQMNQDEFVAAVESSDVQGGGHSEESSDVQGGGDSSWYCSSTKPCVLVITFRPWDLSRKKPVRIQRTIKQSITKPSVLIFEEATSKMLGKLNREDYMMEIEVQDVSQSVTLASNFYFLTVPKDAKGMRKANIKVISVSAQGKNFLISLVSDQPAIFVFIEAWGIRGRFSDNGFHMMKGANQMTQLTFYPWQTTTDTALQDSLQITSLMDVYQFMK